MRHAAQCVGRAIRGKTDYGIMVFADKVSCQRALLIALAIALDNFENSQTKCIFFSEIF